MVGSYNYWMVFLSVVVRIAQHRRTLDADEVRELRG